MQDDITKRLFEAAEQDDPVEIHRLVDAGADVNARNENCHTPLIIAAAGGNANVVKALIKDKADVNAFGRGNMTALRFARQLQHEKVVDILKRHGGQ